MEGISLNVVQGRLNSYQLPNEFSVWDLDESYGELCRRSRQGQVEWGGCIVLKDDLLCVEHLVMGWTDGVDPLDSPADHEHYIGFAHVHLPDDDGIPYFGFSDRDFRGTLADGDNLALVCNGDEVFALVRTSDLTQRRRDANETEFAEWTRVYGDLIQEAQREAALKSGVQIRKKFALNSILLQANREMCRRLGFALYGGVWGKPLNLLYRP